MKRAYRVKHVHLLAWQAALVLVGILSARAQDTETITPPAPTSANQASTPTARLDVMSPDEVFPKLTLEELQRIAGPPTLVTLHYTNTPAVKVLEDLAGQAGLKLVLLDKGVKAAAPAEMAEAQKPITISVDKEPFFAVLRDVLARANLNYSLTPGSTLLKITTTHEDWIGSPSSEYERFIVTLNHVWRNSTQTFAFNAPDKLDVFRRTALAMSFAADPRLPTISEGNGIVIDTIIDDKGESLAPDGKPIVQTQEPLKRGAGYRKPGNALNVWEYVIPLREGIEPGRRIALMKGVLKVPVVTKHDVWEVPDVNTAQGAEKTVTRPWDELHYKFLSAKPDISRDAFRGYRVQFEFKRMLSNTGPNSSIYHLFRFFPTVRLLDADGHPLPSENNVVDINNSKLTLLAMQRPEIMKEAAAPSKIIVETPIEVKVIELPFEFRDLPM